MFAKCSRFHASEVVVKCIISYIPFFRVFFIWFMVSLLLRTVLEKLLDVTAPQNMLRAYLLAVVAISCV